MFVSFVFIAKLLSQRFYQGISIYNVLSAVRIVTQKSDFDENKVYINFILILGDGESIR